MQSNLDIGSRISQSSGTLIVSGAHSSIQTSMGILVEYGSGTTFTVVQKKDRLG